MRPCCGARPEVGGEAILLRTRGRRHLVSENLNESVNDAGQRAAVDQDSQFSVAFERCLGQVGAGRECSGRPLMLLYWSAH